MCYPINYEYSDGLVRILTAQPINMQRGGANALVPVTHCL